MTKLDQPVDYIDDTHFQKTRNIIVSKRLGPINHKQTFMKSVKSADIIFYIKILVYNLRGETRKFINLFNK